MYCIVLEAKLQTLVQKKHETRYKNKLITGQNIDERLKNVKETLIINLFIIHLIFINSLLVFFKRYVLQNCKHFTN